MWDDNIKRNEKYQIENRERKYGNKQRENDEKNYYPHSDYFPLEKEKFIHNPQIMKLTPSNKASKKSRLFLS